MLLAVGKPDARLVAGGEDGDAWGLDGGGEVHGAAVVADEEAGVAEGGGALARGEEAAEIDDRALEFSRQPSAANSLASLSSPAPQRARA